MSDSRNYSGSRKLILFAYINVIICGIFHPKTCISKNVPSWQRFFVCTEVIRVKRFNYVDKRRRENLRIRCIIHHIKHHVFQQINPIQHGFVPRKSYTTQLIKVFEQIGRKLDDGKQMDVIYLDMSKAFDKVSHAQLIRRLYDFGFRGNLLKCLHRISAIVINRQLLVEQHQDL